MLVARFRPLRVMRLLDLTQLGIGLPGSIFDPDYADRTTRLAFLQGFHWLVSRPVLPGDAPLEYLPTQAVAEYVSSVLSLDGLLYGSAQLGAVPDDDDSPEFYYQPSTEPGEFEKHNVVLLGHAARVRPVDGKPSPGASVSANAPTHGLEYVNGSAEARRITRISYSDSRFYVYDPDEPSPF